MAREFYSSGEIISSNNPTTSNTHHQHQHQHQQHPMVNQIQGFDETNPSDHHHHHQIFSLNTNMGVIDFSKQHHHHHHQISMTSGLEETSGGENLLLEDSSSSMRCVFPCEVNERPSQGLSLSLSSSNPTSISLQSFELRPQTQQDHHHVLTTRVVGSARQGYFGKPDQNIQHTQMLMMMNNRNNTNFHHHHHPNQFHIGSSKYLAPAQELLNEFCSLGTKQSDEEIMMMKQKNQKGKQHQWDSNNNSATDHHDRTASTSSRKHVPPLHSLEFMELQKRKTRLLSMLEELDRRYRHYCEQMKAAVSGFEAAAGGGAAAAYTVLASRAMSRHFRCLRDAVVGQIQATRKAMGEKDPVAPGTTRGETPRLRMLDQVFRQQKAYQQMSLMEAHPWRPQRGLPERAVSILRAWLFEHFLHPYPSDVDKHILARQTGLSRSQVSNWFINARVRLWKPMIEEMYMEETKEHEGINNIIFHNNNSNASSSSDHHRVSDEDAMINPMIVDPKPEPNQFIRIDPDSLSSIIANPNPKNDPKTSKQFISPQNQDHQSFGSTFDFPSYGHQTETYAGDSTNQGFNTGTGGVSLTLGLQQHGGNGGVSLAFSPASQGAPLFYGRDHMEDCQQGVQYSSSMLDGDQGQNLPYRNLMGAQLLHDVV